MNKHSDGVQPRPTRIGALALAASLVVASCGGDDDDPADDDAVEVTAEETSAQTTPTQPTTVATTAVEQVTESTAGAAETTAAPTTTIDDSLVVEVIAAPDLGERRQRFTASAMGGISFDADLDHSRNVIGDRIFVTSEADPGNATGGAFIALVSQAADGSRIRTVGEVIDRLQAVDQFTVEASGTAVDLFGYRLAGYDIATADVPPQLALFATNRRGTPPMSVWVPTGDDGARIYVAETPSGVLLAGYDAPAGDPEFEPVFATLLTSAQLTGPGLSPSLAPAQQLGGTGAPPDPVPAIESGPRVLEARFSPVDGGRYQIPNFGVPISIEIPDQWMVQPNFPALVVLTAPGSVGPGDRDLVFVAGLRSSIAPVAGGPIRVGAPFTFDDIDQLLAAPPAGLIVSDVLEADIGGVPATRFDLTVAEGLDCSEDEPCDFAWETSWGFSKVLSSGQHMRVWWLHGTGPQRFIAATDISEDFIDAATLVVESALGLEPEEDGDDD